MKKVQSKFGLPKIGVIKTFSLSPDDEVGEIAVQCSGCTYYYNNLSELCEKWEDVPEESEKFYWIDYDGEVKSFIKSYEWHDKLKQIGNYFETEEEAKKVVEKLKAWQRLKDNWFRFTGWKRDEKYRGDFTMTATDQISCDDKDLDLLFGGGE